MKIEVIKSADVFNTLADHPLQSWEWGEARKKMGIEVLRIGEFAKEKINVYQLTFHPVPLTKFKIGYLPRSSFPSKDILNYLVDYGKKNNIIFIKIEPNVLSTCQVCDGLSKKTWQVLRKSPHPLFPAWTQTLDLTKSEDELLKNMKSKTRYNIKLSEKKGVTVKELSDNEGFKTFSDLYFQTCKRQKYFGHTREYHKIIWETLKNNIAHILIAFYNDIPLAAYELFYFKNKFYYTYGGTSDKFRNLMASNLLMWEAIRLGKKLGASEFDMWGSLPPDYDQNNDWAGFTRFKEGYGTKFVETIGSYDLVIDPFLYAIYNITDKIRKFYLSFRS